MSTLPPIMTTMSTMPGLMTANSTTATIATSTQNLTGPSAQECGMETTCPTSWGSTTIPAGAAATIISSQCDNTTIAAPHIPFTVTAIPVNKNSIQALQDCCGSNPVVLWQGGCSIYCTTGNFSSVQQITQCLSVNPYIRSAFGTSSSPRAAMVKLSGVLLSTLLVTGILVGL